MDDYVCSQCHKPCYYDGRCGDGQILMCDCAKLPPYDAHPIRMGSPWED